MNPLAAIITAVEFSDSDEHEATRIARHLLPDCWDITPLPNGTIRLQHGHKGACQEDAEAKFDQALTWQRVLYELVLLAGPQEVIEARALVSGITNPQATQALRA